MPASVEKLYTTATALLRLGPRGTLTTSVLGDAAVDRGGALGGNLYLRGGGDPTFGTPRRPRWPRRSWSSAGRCARSPARVIGDESAFDGRRGPPSAGYRADLRGRRPLSALTFNHGRTGKRRPYFQASPALFAAQAFAARAAAPRRQRRRAPPRAGAAPRARCRCASDDSPPLAEIVARDEPCRRTTTWPRR